MQLNYRKTKSGLYILKKEDFDDIAYMVLNEYQPIMLEKAQPLDVEDIIYERLFLDMKIARLSVDGKILSTLSQPPPCILNKHILQSRFLGMDADKLVIHKGNTSF